MDSSIQRSTPPPILDQLSSNLDESRVDSLDISQASSSVLGHTISPSRSEITPLKTRKTISFAPTAQAVSEEGVESTHDVKWMPAEQPIQPTITKDPTPRSEEESLTPNKFMLRTSEQIKDGAKAVFTARKQNFETATRMCDKFFNNNPNLDKESIAQIKEKLSVAQDHFTKAQKYSDWTTVRHSLFQGNKERAKTLEEKGYSIGSDWSQQQLEEDWTDAQKEPWATNDALFDLQKTIAAAISKKTSSKSQLPQQAKSEQPQSELHAKTHTNPAHESHADMVFVPGLGDVNRSKQDIGNVEYNEDGTFTIVDMTGRRYDRPRPAPPGDSCVIS